jgi:hypothetical protein
MAKTIFVKENLNVNHGYSYSYFQISDSKNINEAICHLRKQNRPPSNEHGAISAKD